jgi:RES domain
MTCDLESIAPSGELLRLGRAPNPWDWNDWAYAGPDGTFGNRWDDPESMYRVLYGCSQRLWSFMETLGRFPGDPAVQSELELIELEPGEEDNALPAGHLRLADWPDNRLLARATIDGDFAAVGRSRSLSYLQNRLSTVISAYGQKEIDGSAIRQTAPRQLTQRISSLVFECSTFGERQFDGIHYLSHYGDEFENWAIFEPGRIDELGTTTISVDDEDLQEAGVRLGLVFV